MSKNRCIHNTPFRAPRMDDFYMPLPLLLSILPLKTRILAEKFPHSKIFYA